MKGTRTEDGKLPFGNGEYAKATHTKAEDGGPAWFVNPPVDGIGPGLLTKHRVIEHGDGTISVPEGPSINSGSNSILITSDEKSWHGYIYHGIWREIK